MSEFKKEEKKGGIWASLSSLFGGGSSGAGGAAGLGGASGLGAAGSGLGGLFATKAGILGMVLGGATIAAGVGVVYNFIGPSSKPVYSPQLFQDTYYEEQANNAGIERAKQREGASASPSTLDMFREQAKKDGLGLTGEGAAEENKNAAAEAPAVDGAAGAGAPVDGASADASVNAPASGGGGGKLQGSLGFGSKGAGGGGGTSSNIPKMAGGGGNFGGSNNQFAALRAPVSKENGKSGAMKGSKASSIKGSSKYSVPVAKGKNAFGQAKFAGNMGTKSAQGPSLAGSKTGATEAFSGETAGSGDLGTPDGGLGLGGAGVSSANKLKGSDPSINSSEVTPPKVAEPEDVSPWTKYTDMAMYGMLAAAVLIFAANALAKKAKAMAAVAVLPPAIAAAAAVYKAAMICAYLAMAAAAVVIFAGLKLKMGDPNGDPPWTGQNWTGIMYMAAGAMLMYKAYEALTGAQEGKLSADKIGDQMRADSLANGGDPTVSTNAQGATVQTYPNGSTSTVPAGQGYASPTAPPSATPTGTAAPTATPTATTAPTTAPTATTTAPTTAPTATAAPTVPQPPTGATVAPSGNVFNAQGQNIGIMRSDIGFVANTPPLPPGTI